MCCSKDGLLGSHTVRYKLVPTFLTNGTYCLHIQGELICLGRLGGGVVLSEVHIALAFRVKRYKNSLILKINAARFSETSELLKLTYQRLPIVSYRNTTVRSSKLADNMFRRNVRTDFCYTV